jgi:hypothetical protein
MEVHIKGRPYEVMPIRECPIHGQAPHTTRFSINGPECVPCLDATAGQIAADAARDGLDPLIPGDGFIPDHRKSEVPL